MSDSSDLQRFVDARAAIYRSSRAASEKTITDIPGSPDDMKFRSFNDAVRRRLEAVIFAEAVAAFYPDEKDRATLEIQETNRPV
jgi:uncharacterized protein (DUF1810 family)